MQFPFAAESAGGRACSEMRRAIGIDRHALASGGDDPVNHPPAGICLAIIPAGIMWDRIFDFAPGAGCRHAPGAFRWIAGDDHALRDIQRHHRAGLNDGIFADINIFPDDRAAADAHIFIDATIVAQYRAGADDAGVALDGCGFRNNG